MSDEETVLTRGYLQSLIDATEKAEAVIKERGWTSADDAWDKLGPRGALEWEQARILGITGMLAGVILNETILWLKEQVVDEYRRGERIVDIAQRAGINPSTVNIWARSVGVPTRKPGRPPGSKNKPKQKE